MLNQRANSFKTHFFRRALQTFVVEGRESGAKNERLVGCVSKGSGINGAKRLILKRLAST